MSLPSDHSHTHTCIHTHTYTCTHTYTHTLPKKNYVFHIPSDLIVSFVPLWLAPLPLTCHHVNNKSCISIVLSQASHFLVHILQRWKMRHRQVIQGDPAFFSGLVFSLQSFSTFLPGILNSTPMVMTLGCLPPAQTLCSRLT